MVIFLYVTIKSARFGALISICLWLPMVEFVPFYEKNICFECESNNSATWQLFGKKNMQKFQKNQTFLKKTIKFLFQYGELDP